MAFRWVSRLRAPVQAIPSFPQIATGINPAYDEALKFLAQDRDEKLVEISKVQSKLQRIRQSESTDRMG